MTAEEYLLEHALDPEFVKNRLGWSWDTNKITIPHYDEAGKLLYCRYRNLTGDVKFQADKGAKIALYGAHRIKNAHSVILCEGEPDCAKLLQEGFHAVTIGGVKSFNTKTAQPLKDKQVLVLLDNDDPGRSSIQKYCEVLLSVKAHPRIVTLPDGVKDVCEFFAQGNNKPELTEIIAKAQTYDDWLEQNEDEHFSVIPSSDILKKDLPEQAWLIDRIVPVDGITFIVGTEGTGKSFYTLTMGDAIATGKKWLNTFKVNQTAKVLFLDKENVMRRLQNRMKYLQITGENMFHLEYPQYFRLEGDNDGFSDFALKIKRFVEKNDIGLIVFDSFTDFMVGNENSSADTQAFFDSLKQLFGEKAILVIHHANKPSQGVTRTAAQRVRGSSNIMAQIYSMLYVEQLPRSTNEYSIEHVKAGDTEKIKKFKVEMVIDRNMYDKSVTYVTNLRYAGEIEDQELKGAQCEDIIMEELNKNPEIPREDLEAVCTAQGVSTKTFQNTIKKMKDEKVIDSVPNPKNKLKRIITLV